MRNRTLLAAFGVSLAIAAPVHAQHFRSYLSTSGNDANACTLAAPCRLLPAALAATAEGGEVWMLDSANYNTGPVAVTKSVSILAVPGVLGSLVTSGGNALVVPPGTTRLTVRNLSFSHVPGTGNGSAIALQGGELRMENCTVAHIADAVAVSGGARAVVVGSTFTGVSSGVLVNGGTATVDRSNFIRSFIGLWIISHNSSAHVTNSVFAFSNYGVYVVSQGGLARGYVKDSVFAANGSGPTADSSVVGTNALVEMSGSLLSGNTSGAVITKGQIQTSGTNRFANNGTDVFGGTLTAAGSY